MFRGTLCVLFGSLILLGCAGTIGLQPLPADHPANPEAPEAPMQPPPQAPRATPGDSSEGPGGSPSEHPMSHEHESSSGDQTQPKTGEPDPPEGAVYTCPMHPEVKASAPGRCPRCGMALKQREEK